MRLLLALARAARAFVRELRAPLPYTLRGEQVSCPACGHRRFHREQSRRWTACHDALKCAACGGTRKFAPNLLHIMHPGVCPGCEYDLTGSLAAGSTTCPECGRPIPPEFMDGLGAAGPRPG